MPRTSEFDASVPLPPGLTIAALRKAIAYIERELADLIDTIPTNGHGCEAE